MLAWKQGGTLETTVHSSRSTSNGFEGTQVRETKLEGIADAQGADVDFDLVSRTEVVVKAGRHDAPLAGRARRARDPRDAPGEVAAPRAERSPPRERAGHGRRGRLDLVDGARVLRLRVEDARPAQVRGAALEAGDQVDVDVVERVPDRERVRVVGAERLPLGALRRGPPWPRGPRPRRG